MGARFGALTMLAMAATSCEADCRDLTKHEFVLEWNDLYDERCHPGNRDWTPLYWEGNCTTTGFHPCRARSCLDAWDASADLCADTTFRNYPSCADVFDSEFCGYLD